MKLAEFTQTMKTFSIAFSRYMNSDPQMKNEQLDFFEWKEQFDLFVEERYSDQDDTDGWG